MMVRIIERAGAALLCLALLAQGACARSAGGERPAQIDVIVMEKPGAGNGPEAAVARAEGAVTRQLAIINGFSATVPASRVEWLRSQAGVLAVEHDGSVRFESYDGFDPTTATGSTHMTN